MSLNSASSHARGQRWPLRSPCLAQACHSENPKEDAESSGVTGHPDPRKLWPPEAAFGAPARPGVVALPRLLLQSAPEARFRPQAPGRLAVTCLQGTVMFSASPSSPRPARSAPAASLSGRPGPPFSIRSSHVLGGGPGRGGQSVWRRRGPRTAWPASRAARSLPAPRAAAPRFRWGDLLAPPDAAVHRPAAPRPPVTHTTCHTGPVCNLYSPMNQEKDSLGLTRCDFCVPTHTKP